MQPPNQQPPQGQPPQYPYQQPPQGQNPYPQHPPPQYPYQQPPPQGQYPYQQPGYPPAPAPKKGGFPVWGWFVIILVILVLVTGGGYLVTFGFGDPSIKSAVMAKGFKDNKAVDETKVFSPKDNPFNCVVNLNNPKIDTKVKAVWSVVDAEGTQNQQILDKEVTTENRESVVQFTLSLPRDWPTGKYKVDLYLNNTLDRTLEFSVS
jgi:hypothetical protein